MASIRDKPHDPRTTNHYVRPASLLPVWTCLAPLRRPLSRAGSTRRNHPRPAMAQPLATRAQPRAATARDLATRAGLSWPTVLGGYGWCRRSRRDLGSPGLPSQGSAWSPSLPALPPPAADLDDPPATARAKSSDAVPPAPTRRGNRVNIRIMVPRPPNAGHPVPESGQAASIRDKPHDPRATIHYVRPTLRQPLSRAGPPAATTTPRPRQRRGTRHGARVAALTVTMQVPLLWQRRGTKVRDASGGIEGNHARPLAMAAQRNQDPGREWRCRR